MIDNNFIIDGFLIEPLIINKIPKQSNVNYDTIKKFIDVKEPATNSLGYNCSFVIVDNSGIGIGIFTNAT
jgi:hypothetical protein